MKDFIKKIVDKGELLNFVAGFPEYRVAAQGLVPTDTEAVVEAVKDDLISDPSFRETFYQVLLDVAKMPEYGWTTLYYILDLYWLGKSNNLDLVPSFLVTGISDELRKQKEGLEKNFDWEGSQKQNGLWGDVQRMNRSVHKSTGITVLPEEF